MLWVCIPYGFSQSQRQIGFTQTNQNIGIGGCRERANQTQPTASMFDDKAAWKKRMSLPQYSRLDAVPSTVAASSEDSTTQAPDSSISFFFCRV